MDTNDKINKEEPETISLPSMLTDGTRDIYLIEFHGDELQIPAELGTGMIRHFKGLKICRIIDKDSNIVARYDQINDKMDVSSLCKENTSVVFVGSTNGLNLEWITAEIEAWNTEKTEIVINHKRLCSFEEIKKLNEMYPEYYEHCSLNKEEFEKKNIPEMKKAKAGNIEIPKE